MAQTDATAHFRSNQAADYLQIAEATLRKSRVLGVLCGRPAPKYSKMGRTVLYKKAELDNWLSELPTGRSKAEVAA